MLNSLGDSILISKPKANCSVLGAKLYCCAVFKMFEVNRESLLSVSSTIKHNKSDFSPISGFSSCLFTFPSKDMLISKKSDLLPEPGLSLSLVFLATSPPLPQYLFQAQE